MYNDKLIETMKEKIWEAFAELGFQLEQMDDFGYGFSYEGTNFIFMPNADDEEFLNICIPGIYDLEEESPLSFIELMNKINSTLKYIKAYELGKSIWLFYLAEIIGMSMALKYFKDTHAKEAFRIFYIATGSRIMISG